MMHPGRLLSGAERIFRPLVRGVTCVSTANRCTSPSTKKAAPKSKNTSIQREQNSNLQLWDSTIPAGKAVARVPENGGARKTKPDANGITVPSAVTRLLEINLVGMTQPRERKRKPFPLAGRSSPDSIDLHERHLFGSLDISDPRCEYDDSNSSVSSSFNGI